MLYSNDYIEHENNSGRSKSLSIEEYFNKVRPNLKHITNDFK